MRIRLLSVLLLASPPVGAQDAVERATVVDSLEIAPVWSAHPVGFALLTHAPRQFVAFYDDKRQLTVAQRELDKREWEFAKLPVTTGWDSHNYLAMAVDDDGYLHLSGDMHVVPLKYFRSAKPLDATSFERLDRMTGADERRATYPKFLRGPRNEFIFTYRDGSSGDGNQIFNVYDAKTKTWGRLLDSPLTDGEGERNAYFDGPVRGPDGFFHMAWVWRETPDAATNHDLSYARSKDLKRWETGAGKPLELPIRWKDCEIVDPVPVNGGIINGNAKIGFDDKGRVTISYHKHDARGDTQPWTARLEDGAWKTYQIADWRWRWEFGGGGTLNFGIAIGPVTAEADGRLTQSWRHLRFGGGTWLLDPGSLQAIGAVRRQSAPPGLGKIEGGFDGLKARINNDSGKSDRPGVRYLLRHETLDANQDRARQGALPGPSMLRLYAVAATTGPAAK